MLCLSRIEPMVAMRRIVALMIVALMIVPGSLFGQGSNQSLLSQGEELLRSGSYAAASDVFLRTQGIDREEGVVGASRALAVLGNTDEAIRLCEEALLGSSPQALPLIATQLAELLRSTGRSRDALSILADVD